MTTVTVSARQPRLARGVGALAVGVALFLALWMMAESAVAALGGSLAHLLPVLPLAVALAVAGAVGEARSGGFPVAEGPVLRRPAPGAGETTLAAAAVLALAACLLAGPWLAAAWLAAVLAVAGLAWSWRCPTDDGVAIPERPRRDAVLLALCVAVALAVTLLSNRPDGDDAAYLRVAMTLNATPDGAIAVLSLPKAAATDVHRWNPYAALAALLAWAPDSMLPVYYLWLPAVQAVMVVLVAYLCARAFVGGDAGLVTAVFMLMLLAWGEAHRAPGNFAFVRLFQGKAALASWGLPLVFLSAIRLARQVSRWNAVVLAAALGGAVCLSHAGVTLAPVAAALGVLAGWPRRWGRRGVAALVALPAVLVLAVAAAHWLAPAFLRPRAVVAALALGKVFPWGFHAAWALAAPVVAALALGGSGGTVARRLVPMVLVVVNPWVLEALGSMTDSLSWRILWVLPFPVLAAVAVVAVGRRERGVARPPVLAASLLAAFLGAGQWIVSGATGNRFGEVGLIMDPGFSAPLRRVLDHPDLRRLPAARQEH